MRVDALPKGRCFSATTACDAAGTGAREKRRVTLATRKVTRASSNRRVNMQKIGVVDGGKTEGGVRSYFVEVGPRDAATGPPIPRATQLSLSFDEL